MKAFERVNAIFWHQRFLKNTRVALFHYLGETAARSRKIFLNGWRKGRCCKVKFLANSEANKSLQMQAFFVWQACRSKAVECLCDFCRQLRIGLARVNFQEFSKLALIV